MFFIQSIFKIINQKISFHKDLIIQPVNILIGMMMSYQIFHSADHPLLKAQCGKHLAGSCRTFCFLRLSIRASVFFHTDFDPDIMNESRSFQNMHRIFIQTLTLADQP